MIQSGSDQPIDKTGRIITKTDDFVFILKLFAGKHQFFQKIAIFSPGEKPV